MENSSTEVSEWPEIWLKLNDGPICSDQMKLISRIASKYSLVKDFGQLDPFMAMAQQRYGATKCWREVFLTDEKFVLALIDSKIHRGEFHEVYQLIEMVGRISGVETKIALWNRAHYEEERMKIGKKLTSVMKYRVRARFPPPLNLHPSGKRVSMRLSKSSAEILKRWFLAHAAEMPTPETIENLAREADLTTSQVKNWFKRSIVKYKKEQAEKQHQSPNPIAKLNPCLQQAAISSANEPPLVEQQGSPTKYLNQYGQGCLPPQTAPTAMPAPALPLSDAQESSILEIQNREFLGYVPAYCIRVSGILLMDKPIVMFDARTIHQKIPDSVPSEAASGLPLDLAMTYKTICPMDPPCGQQMNAQGVITKDAMALNAQSN